MRGDDSIAVHLLSAELDICIPGRKGTGWLLSARRLWEHTQYGQIDPFGLAHAASGAWSPDDVIDVVRVDGEQETLLEVTLAEVRAGRTARIGRDGAAQILESLQFDPVAAFRHAVRSHLDAVLKRVAVRRGTTPFLPVDSCSPVGLSHLHSKLQRQLLQQPGVRKPPAQWRGILQNLLGKGLSQDELAQSGVLARLHEAADPVLT